MILHPWIMILATIWLSLIHMANNIYVFEYHKHIFCLVWFICVNNFIHVIKVHPFNLFHPQGQLCDGFPPCIYFYLSITQLIYMTISLKKVISFMWSHFIHLCTIVFLWSVSRMDKTSFIWHISFWCLFEVCFVMLSNLTTLISSFSCPLFLQLPFFCPLPLSTSFSFLPHW